MGWRAFWRGFGSVLDLSGSSHWEGLPERLRRLPVSDEEALAMDRDAIASDWQAVGEDLAMATRRVRRGRGDASGSA